MRAGTSLFGRLLNDALVRGSTVLITYLRTGKRCTTLVTVAQEEKQNKLTWAPLLIVLDQSLQLHRECGFEVSVAAVHLVFSGDWRVTPNPK